MKKSGFDFQLPILYVLITQFSLMLVNLMNMIFYMKYLISLACSLLSLIPKIGNLMLPKNYRGIQMMKSLACLYDRIITNRLKVWLPINVNQTAFQKLKSTLIHIFTIRILCNRTSKEIKDHPIYRFSWHFKSIRSCSTYATSQETCKDRDWKVYAICSSTTIFTDNMYT